MSNDCVYEVERKKTVREIVRLLKCRHGRERERERERRKSKLRYSGPTKRGDKVSIICCIQQKNTVMRKNKLSKDKKEKMASDQASILRTVYKPLFTN